MSPPAFVCICNPVEVWDHEAFFASGPGTGYWVFPKTAFDRVAVGSRLFLRITSKGRLPGVCGAFTVLDRKTGECPPDHWREGKHPKGLQRLVTFAVESYFPNRRLTPEDLVMAGIPSTSRLLRVPQQMAAEIPSAEADSLSALIGQRLAMSAT